jgi:tetratricopeptide (TPR) repeat protein
MHCLIIILIKLPSENTREALNSSALKISLSDPLNNSESGSKIPSGKPGGEEYARACALLGEHKYEKSVELFDNYLKNGDPSVRHEVLLKRADALMGMNEYDLAEEDLKEVIKEGKNGATPLLYAAVLYHNLDQDGDAYKSLKAAYSINPDLENDPYFTDRTEKNYDKNAALSDFYTIAGKIAHDAGHSEEGLQFIDKAIQKGSFSPISSLAYLEKGLIFFKTQRYAEAGENARIWLKKYAPDPIINIESYENFSDAYMMTGNYKKALEYINKLIEAKPDFPGFYINRGRIYLIKGDYGAARTDFEKVRSLADRGESYDAVELNRLNALLKKLEKSK